ncbi:glycosyltransferase family 2 protein [Rhabdobacter roseus]|uniref:Glycosyltransferase involved in cell wall biosynthesis n=1 Tax=Rhabdobacter roseus TaxID=1655419 RepID=A0A840TIG0_9BACT|nr:glycosyltransferase family 2 protein [Rhabdobacter roseus]MBB5283254.1 glycosyltransferase involved in cell wall biosynthesis [Rhabdobacter roseus]
MFSIIIPLYNKAKYIHKAVQSVLEQEYKDFELIVINDGSTDDSLKAIEGFQDSRLKILHQENLGVAKARNNGVKAAQYAYIAFLDADDWWHPSFLSEMTTLIKDFPEAGIYGSKYYWVKNGVCKESLNHETDDFRGYIDYFNAYTHAWWMPLTSISVVIVKSILSELNGFNGQLKFGEDFDLWIRIALAHKVAYLNKPLAYYNQDVASAGRALGGKRWKKEVHFIFNLDYLDEAEQQHPSLKYLLDGLRVRSLLTYYLRGDYQAEVQALLAKIDFSLQSRYYQRIYQMPKFLIIAYLFGKKAGSLVKQTCMKWIKIKK